MCSKYVLLCTVVISFGASPSSLPPKTQLFFDPWNKRPALKCFSSQLRRRLERRKRRPILNHAASAPPAVSFFGHPMKPPVAFTRETSCRKAPQVLTSFRSFKLTKKTTKQSMVPAPMTKKTAGINTLERMFLLRSPPSKLTESGFSASFRRSLTAHSLHVAS